MNVLCDFQLITEFLKLKMKSSSLILTNESKVQTVDFNCVGQEKWKPQ